MKLPSYFSPHIYDFIENLSEERETPFLVLDLNVIESRYHELRQGFNNTHIYYAVKANPADEIIERLVHLGSNFDLASVNELNKVLKFKVEPSRLAYGNTIKKKQDIQYFYDHGVRLFVTDAEADLRNIATYAPHSKVFFRLSIDCAETADWPLSKKFGCDSDALIGLAILAKELGLTPYGISFHVGSQQRDIQSWQHAITETKAIFDQLRDKHDIHLSMLNLGGGLPAHYRQKTETFNKYTSEINEYLKVFDEYELEQIMIEPGRSLVGDAGILISEIILISHRPKLGCKRWIYTDVGVFNGLIETIGESVEYPVLSNRTGEVGSVIIAGPTCDSMDIMYQDKDYALPTSLEIGDHLYWVSTGAYTTSYSSIEFNGFSPLNYYVLK